MTRHFVTFLESQMAGRPQQDAAAAMGLRPAQLCKVLKGGGCERTTLAKIVGGISADETVRAECLAAWLRDAAAQAGPEAGRIVISVKREP